MCWFKPSNGKLKIKPDSTPPLMRTSWRPIDSSSLNLRNQYTIHNLTGFPSMKSPQDDRIIDSTRKDQRKDMKVPPKIIGPPRPPGPEECCMSGCAICVYDIYAQESEEYLDSLKQRNDLQEDLDVSSIKSLDANPRLLAEEIDEQLVLNNSLKIFAQFEKTLHRAPNKLVVRMIKPTNRILGVDQEM
ncbi:hypothetical protein H4Q26_017113 [Puccinia striiformis f. sp. tritici PST-130]|nr:hypothetical protein H4Q26_017113 [Puccinia striiformis f. sp. tritici PST-130]